MLAAPQMDFSGFSDMVTQAQQRSEQQIGTAAQQLSFNAEQGRQRGAAQERQQLAAGPASYGETLGAWNPQGAVAPADSWGERGFGENVPRSLIQTESGGNFQATNDVQGSGGKGHFGLVQFSRGRLADAIAGGAIGQMTAEEFAQNDDAQVAATNWHFNDIDNYIKDRGLNSYVGREVNGAALSMNSLRAIAHLGGRNGMQRYLESNGQYNPADAYGTSLSDYAARHAG